MDNYKRKKSSSELIKIFVPYFKGYSHILIIDLICALFTTFCEVIFPLMIRQITINAINGTLVFDYVLKTAQLYLFLRVVDTVASYYMASVGHIMGAGIERDMRKDLFSHLQKLSFSYYDKTKIGQIMGRITSDLFEIAEFAHHCPEEFFIAGVKITVSFLILSRINPILTIIVYSVIPLMLFGTSYFRKKMRIAFKRSREQIGELNADVEDSLLGVRIVRSFANEDMEEEKFAVSNDRLLDIKRFQYKYMAGFRAVTQFFDGLMYFTVILFASKFMLSGKITPADMVAYTLYVSTLLMSIRRIVEFAEQFERGMTGIERFSEVMETPVEIKDSIDAVDIDNPEGDIKFDNVSFKYSSGDGMVISNLDLHIKKGQKIALVGPSGSGKTTLCNLIPRFYDVSSGKILLDNIDITKIKLHSLRDHIGMVQQDVYIFSGTVFQNIEYGKPGASHDEVIEAAKLAGADEFISKLDKGYDTYVGERGVRLSGGQKQRISIARVFLKNPPILILDEATSSLDNESERLIQNSLEKLEKGRTVFTIAHRLTTVKNADRILVMTDGGIVESGTHKELMALQGEYYNLYKLTEENLD